MHMVLKNDLETMQLLRRFVYINTNEEMIG